MSAHFLVIHLPGPIEPLERGDRFEDPLDAALEEAGELGSCVGGGTSFTAEAGVTGCDIELEVTDLPRALPLIRDVLVKAGAPNGTVVKDLDSDTVCLRLAAGRARLTLPKPGKKAKRFCDSCPWPVGTVLGYRITERKLVLLHVVGGMVSPEFRVLEWVGAKVPPASDIARLVRARPWRWRFVQSHLVVQLKAGDRNQARFVPAGVTLPPKRLGGYGPCGHSWPEFDQMLKEFFGLVRVSTKTRLNHDLGLVGDHLAVWDSPTRVVPDEARKLFHAHACKFYVRQHPDRARVAPTEDLRQFIKTLKQHFRPEGDRIWNGTFSAAEGFVIVPLNDGCLAEVWPVATALARRHGLTCFDPQSGKLGP